LGKAATGGLGNTRYTVRPATGSIAARRALNARLRNLNRGSTGLGKSGKKTRSSKKTNLRQDGGCFLEKRYTPLILSKKRRFRKVSARERPYKIP